MCACACVRALEQQRFEARLGQRLEAADAALRRQLETSVARLEAKLDLLAHASACPCCRSSQSQQLSGQRAPPLMQGMGDEIFEAKGRVLKQASLSKVYPTQRQQGQDRQKALPLAASLEKRLEQIASAVGVKAAGDEDDDKKRLKEKLKQAIERDKRNRIRTIVSEHAKWLEYVFGICKADQRLGKKGSRLFGCVGLGVDFRSMMIWVILTGSFTQTHDLPKVNTVLLVQHSVVRDLFRPP